jgi:hypothetical protein
MEEASEHGKESSHSARASGMKGILRRNVFFFFFLNCLTLNMKPQQSFKLLNTINPTALHNIPKGLDFLSVCGKLLILLNPPPNPNI